MVISPRSAPVAEYRNLTVGGTPDDRQITVRREDRDQTMRDHGLITVRPDDGNHTLNANRKPTYILIERM